MATLQGKKVVVVGGSSGIGYSVAKASLISLADGVIIASSSQSKIDAATTKLLAEPELQQLPNLQSRVLGGTLDLTDTKAIAAFFEKIGEVDHLIITSGNILNTVNFKEDDLDKFRSKYQIRSRYRPDTDIVFRIGAFDLRFWGAAHAAQKAKIRQGGSITFTIGTCLCYSWRWLSSLTQTCRQCHLQASSYLASDCRCARIC